MIRLSIVIPARNEAENIGALIDSIQAVCADQAGTEIVVVDDGATDGTGEVVRGRMGRMDNLRLLAHARSAGQSAAIRSGVLAARGEVICTLDGDGQNPPEDLPKLYGPFLDGGDGVAALGLLAGQRGERQDSRSKKLASWLANALRSRLLRDGTRDTGCGLKAFRREDYLRLPYFDHMHRFLPALFRREGLPVQLIEVGHRPRQGGTSHYTNLQRALVGAVDLFGVMWLIRRGGSAAASEIIAGRSETEFDAVVAPRALRA